ncbi:MAG: DUF6252 family protein, partial [Bacteroidota bacterium]
MRFSVIFIFTTFVTFALLLSCDDAFLDTNVNPPEENPITPPEETKGLMKATIDGQDWQTANASALIQVNRIGISGLAEDGSVLILSLEDMGEGNYQLTQNSLSAGAYTKNDNSNAFTSNASSEGGFVNITELNWQDSTISGTFEFVGARAIPAGEVEIKSGEFNQLPVRTELTSINDFNKISVKVNGELFEPVAALGQIDPFANAIAITGTAAEGIPSVALYLPKDISEGTYDLGTPGLADYGGQYNLSDMEFLAAESGEV